MNFSLLIIFLMVCIIAVLIWQFFDGPPKTSVSSLVEWTTGEIKKNHSVKQKQKIQPSFSSLSSIDSSLLYPSLQTAEVVTAIRQRELSFESIIRVMAPKDENFMGYTLLQSLQNTGMRYGERGLFYYYDSQDKLIFSIAPMGNAPVFDIENIGIFKTPGLILTLRDRDQWDLMQKMAHILADELGGEVKC